MSTSPGRASAGITAAVAAVALTIASPAFATVGGAPGPEDDVTGDARDEQVVQAPAREELDDPVMAAHPAAALDEPWRTVVGAAWDESLTERWLAAAQADGDAMTDRERAALVEDVAARSLVLLAGTADSLDVAAPVDDGAAPRATSVTVVDPDGVLPTLPDVLAARGAEPATVPDAAAGPAVLVLGPRASTHVEPSAPVEPAEPSAPVEPADPATSAEAASAPAATPTPPPVRELTPERERLLGELTATHPEVVVVLVDDGQLRTPWRDDVGAVLQTWAAVDADATAGAVADVLTGQAAPTGRLPVALPVGAPDRAQGSGLASLDDSVRYEELTTTDDGVVTVRVHNDADTAVSEVVQAYAVMTADDADPVTSLVGWTTVTLEPGATADVDVELRPLPAAATADDDTTDDATWTLAVGRAADDLPLTADVPLGPTVPEDDAPEPQPSDDGVATPPNHGTATGTPPSPAPGPEDGTAIEDATTEARTSTDDETSATDETADPAVRQAPSGSARIDLRATVPPAAPSGGLRLTVGPGTAHLTAQDADDGDDTLALTGALPNVTVDDTRTQAVGWSVSARAGDLVAGDGTAALPASTLGWTPAAVLARPGLRLGPHVAGAGDGGPGLAQPALLATARGAARLGTTTLRADLEMEVGRDTPPGTYAGTVTVTLFPVD